MKIGNAVLFSGEQSAELGMFRVELNPATDAWMMGDRYGTIIKAGRKYAHVRMDKSKRVLRVTPDLLSII